MPVYLAPNQLVKKLSDMQLDCVLLYNENSGLNNVDK